MGRKLDALLRRNFNTSKLKATAELAISRIKILKNQRQIRLTHARSDVIELLNMGCQEQALIRVEHVIEEQKKLDAFLMIEIYFRLLIERAMLLQNKLLKECPDELKEAISGLIYASSRCGEIPEVLKIREIFTSKFGKEFATSAVELRNSCSVNPKITQKFSIRKPSLETRLEVLKGIASDIGVILQLKQDTPQIGENKTEQEPNGLACKDDFETARETVAVPTKTVQSEEISERMETGKSYDNVAVAAEEAFESEAYAAVAARAAVHLSKSESVDSRSDASDANLEQQTMSNSDEEIILKTQVDGDIAPEETEFIGHSNHRASFVKVHPDDNFSSESESEEDIEELEESKSEKQLIRTHPASSLDSGSDVLTKEKLTSNASLQREMMDEDINSSEHGDESTKTEGIKHHELGSANSFPMNKHQNVRQSDKIREEEPISDDSNELPNQSPNGLHIALKQIPTCTEQKEYAGWKGQITFQSRCTSNIYAETGRQCQ